MQDPIAAELKEVNEGLNKLLNEDSEPAPAKDTSVTPAPDKKDTAKESDTPEVDKKVADAEGGEVKKEEKPKGGESKPDHVEAKPGEQEVLLAGKYKTPEDLTKGVESLINELKLDKLDGTLSKLIKAQIDDAKKSGDYKNIESLYKELQATYSKIQAKAKEDKGKEKADDAEEIEPAERTKKEDEWIAGEALRQLDSHPIKAEFAKRGLNYPPITTEEQNELEAEHPVLYLKYMSVVNKVRIDLRSWVDGRRKLEAEQDGIVETRKAEALEYISQTNEKLKLGLKEEQIKDFIQSALENEEILEEKYGLKIPKEKGIAKLFLSEKLPEIIGVAIENAKVEGRLEQAKDLAKLQELVISTASTAQLNKSQKVSAPGKLDLTKSEDVDSLSLKQVNEELERIANE